MLMWYKKLVTSYRQHCDLGTIGVPYSPAARVQQLRKLVTSYSRHYNYFGHCLQPTEVTTLWLKQPFCFFTVQLLLGYFSTWILSLQQALSYDLYNAADQDTEAEPLLLIT